MTLNTSYFAGVSYKSNVTRGVPRLEGIAAHLKESEVASRNSILRQKC